MTDSKSTEGTRASPLEPGERIGEVEIIALVGRDSWAYSYRAHDHRHGRPVLLAELCPEFCAVRELDGRPHVGRGWRGSFRAILWRLRRRKPVGALEVRRGSIRRRWIAVLFPADTPLAPDGRGLDLPQRLTPPGPFPWPRWLVRLLEGPSPRRT